jgi:hypothetical protein
MRFACWLALAYIQFVVYATKLFGWIVYILWIMVSLQYCSCLGTHNGVNDCKGPYDLDD